MRQFINIKVLPSFNSDDRRTLKSDRKFSFSANKRRNSYIILIFVNTSKLSYK